MFYQLYPIHTTTIYYSDHCSNLLTSPSFYPPSTLLSYTVLSIQQPEPPLTLSRSFTLLLKTLQWFAISPGVKVKVLTNGLQMAALSAALLTPLLSSSFLPLLTLFQRFHLFVIPRTYQFLWICYFFFLEFSSPQISPWLTSSPHLGFAEVSFFQWGLL